MAKVRYTIKTSEGMIPAEGTAVGRFLAIRTVTAGKAKEYVIDHVPTGMRIGDYDRLANAKKVGATLDRIFGDMLAETNADHLIGRLRLYAPDVVEWIPHSSREPDLERFREARRAQREEKERSEEVRRQWKGKRFHYVSGDLYGSEGRVEDVSEEGGRMKAVVEWEGERRTLGHVLDLSRVSPGAAPSDMPWRAVTGGEVTRVNGIRYMVWARPSGRATLWTPDFTRSQGGISQYEPLEFDSRDEAKAFARTFALRRTGGRAKAATGNVARGRKTKRRSIVNPFG